MKNPEVVKLVKNWRANKNGVLSRGWDFLHLDDSKQELVVSHYDGEVRIPYEVLLFLLEREA